MVKVAIQSRKVPTRLVGTSVAVDVTPGEFSAAQLFGKKYTSTISFVVDGVFWVYEGWVFYYHMIEGRIAVMHDINSKDYPFSREEEE